MKQLLLTATVLLATNAYIIFQLMDHSTMQVNTTYNNLIFVSNCYTTNVVYKEPQVVYKETRLVAVTKSESSIAKCDSTKGGGMLQLPTTVEDDGILYNATAWLQDKSVFFKYFSIYSSYDL